MGLEPPLTFVSAKKGKRWKGSWGWGRGAEKRLRWKREEGEPVRLNMAKTR